MVLKNDKLKFEANRCKEGFQLFMLRHKNRQLEMGIVFVEQTNILRTNEIFCKKGCRSEKNERRMKWIVQRSEKSIVLYKQREKRTISNCSSNLDCSWTILFVLLFTKRTIFPKKLVKNDRFLLNQRFFSNSLY